MEMRESLLAHSGFWKVWLITVLLLINPVRAFSQCNYAAAKAILKALYPEIADRNFVITVRDTASLDDERGMTDFSIALQERTFRDAAKTEVSLKDYLGAKFFFPAYKDGRVYQLSVGGPFVNESKLEGLRKLVDSHREWSDEQVVSALETAGARLGPSEKEAFSATLPLKLLEPFLGKLTVLSVDFRLRDRSEMKNDAPAAELYWAVYVEARYPGRKLLRYYLAFEPFEGRLISLGRTPPIDLLP